MSEILDFYKNKKVLVTGHTGFKGSWLCRILINAGAQVLGYSLEPPTEPNLFSLAGIEDKIDHVIGDIRDLKKLSDVFDRFQPEIVFHLAAQPIVRESYKNPVGTYETNVMGTVNICECVRTHESVRSFLNVTTDKVYKNNEWAWGYRENEPLDGYDPYSNSKSCSELVTHSYINSFYDIERVRVSTARAGNVIGGGDFAVDRIIPDCVRAAEANPGSGKIIVRNPYSTRPYQHVLEPLFAYLMIAAKQYDDKKYAGFYNVGPDEKDCVNTGDLVTIFCDKWGDNLSWINRYDGGPHEANFLKLDCSLLKSTLGWKPKWGIEEAIQKTIEWSKVYMDGGNIVEEMDREIAVYCNL
ncbi:MAG: CDP-glucose 4,6-dehydratase [Eubacterium sp.]|nr:CDP-glucose 4,6-dehydratase [Eubacterium sp.]